MFSFLSTQNSGSIKSSLPENFTDQIKNIVLDGNLEQLDQWIVFCANMDLFNNKTISKILKYVIRYGKVEMLRFLIKKDYIEKFIRYDDNILSDTLKEAYFKEHAECIKILIQVGTDITCVEDPFQFYLCRFIKKILTQQTISQKTQKSQKDCKLSFSLDTPIGILCHAIESNNEKLFNQYMKFDIDVNEKSELNTPLEYALYYGRSCMIKSLLKKGANINNSRMLLIYLLDRPQEFNKEYMKCLQLLLNAGLVIESDCVNHRLVKLFRNMIIGETNQNSRLLIKEIINEPCEHVIGALHGTQNIVKLISENHIGSGVITSENVNIEYPTNNDPYYLLPIGIMIDGVTLEKTTICRFLCGHISVNDTIIPLTE